MTTFAQLFDSGLTIIVDPIYRSILEKSGEFESVLGRMENDDAEIFYEEFAEKKYAVIARCDIILVDRNIRKNSQSADFYYVLLQAEKATMKSYKCITTLYSSQGFDDIGTNW